MILKTDLFRLAIVAFSTLMVAFGGTNAAWGQSDKTLRIALPTLPTSLINPFRASAPPSIYITSAIFETLTQFDGTGELQPALATGWEREDELSWRFDLRKGVQFSNGEPFDAEAVIATVAFLVSDEALTEGVRREIDFLSIAEAIDSHSVRIVTQIPVPTLPRYIAALPIIPPRHFNELGLDKFAKDPVGTGPFKLELWETNRIRLGAYEDAWRRPKLDAVEFSAVPNPSSRVAGILSDVVELALDINPDDSDLLRQSGDAAQALLTDSVSGISFFLTRPSPFDDVRVRQAVNMAIDRQTLIDVLLGGTTVPANQPAGRQTLGYNPDIPLFPYDPERAKALLAEAGLEDGFSFDLETSIGYEPNDAAIYQQIAQYLSAIGVEMKVVVIPAAEYLTRRGSGRIEAEAFTSEWPSWPTLDSLRAVSNHSCLRRPVAWYCNEELTMEIQSALVEEDQAKALSMRQDIMARYHELAPALFMFEVPQFWGLRGEVENFSIAVNKISYHELSLR